MINLLINRKPGGLRTGLSAAVLLLTLNAMALSLTAGSHYLNYPTAGIMGGDEFYLTHRFRGVVGKDTFIGMDAGANVGLGFGMKVLPPLEVSVSRSNVNDEYCLAGKLNLLQNDTVGLSVFSGATAKGGQIANGNRSSFFAQMILTANSPGDVLSLSLIPTLATATDIIDPNPSQNQTLALGGALSYFRKIQAGYLEEIGLIGEYEIALSGYHLPNPSASIGLKLKTWGHYFTLLFSNVISDLPNGYVIGSNSLDYHFGFNLAREF